LRPIRLRRCGPAHHRRTGLVDWSKCDAFCFGLRPFDRPLCFCLRRKGASLQTATCHRSSQPRVWTHAFRRSCKTRRLATTIHPNSAGADLRRPERIARNRATMSHCRDATSVHSPDLNPIDRSSPSSSTCCARPPHAGRNQLQHNRRNPPSICAHRMHHQFPKLSLCPIPKESCSSCGASTGCPRSGRVC
jgi:hypothetical protein